MKKPPPLKARSFSDAGEFPKGTGWGLVPPKAVALEQPQHPVIENLRRRLERIGEEFTRLEQCEPLSARSQQAIDFYLRLFEKTFERAISKATVQSSTSELPPTSSKEIDEFLTDLVATENAKLSPEDKLKKAQAQLARISKRVQEQKGQAAQPEKPLPAKGKGDISESTYGKQQRAAKMSDKVKDAIKKGVHPGKFVFDELIYPSRETLEHIAEKIDVHWVTLSSLKNGRRNLSPQLASKLSRYFQKYSTVELLMIQAGHDAMKADQQVIGLHEEKDPTPA